MATINISVAGAIVDFDDFVHITRVRLPGGISLLRVIGPPQGTQPVADTHKSANSPPSSTGTCPICLCEPESPVVASCKHTYCLGCLEGYCRASASSWKAEGFGIKCQGDGGICETNFSLSEIKQHISPVAFEKMLEACFHEYVRQIPEKLHYCPTPNCGFVYRCGKVDFININATVTCENCRQSVCTVCRARHPKLTCAEYQETLLDGYAELQKLKGKLDIRTCPRCKTWLQKDGGCNHIMCSGCRTHICWVCMQIFDSSRPCYAHLAEHHGGNGLQEEDLEEAGDPTMNHARNLAFDFQRRLDEIAQRWLGVQLDENR